MEILQTYGTQDFYDFFKRCLKTFLIREQMLTLKTSDMQMEIAKPKRRGKKKSNLHRK